jgi:hypothetical protein
MCSKPAQRIAEIGQAIDDLAAQAGSESGNDTGSRLTKLAELWGLLAELDPEVAKRLVGYQSITSQAD